MLARTTFARRIRRGLRTALITAAAAVVGLVHPPARVAAQPLRLEEIARRHDVVVLVADARTGRRLGGIRVAESRTERHSSASLFKIAIAVTALESSARPGSVYLCDGSDTIGGAAYRCWLDTGHGRLGLRGAIAHSCNLYFHALATRLSLSELASRARALGLMDDGAATITPATLLGDASPVTPEMLMNTALTLASRGRLSTSAQSFLASPRYRPLYDGLRECVSSGTAKSAWMRRTAVAGKTGTAEVEGNPRRHVGWFIGFAPFDRPQYAIVVLHRKGIGSDAAAVAREVFETLF